MAVSGALYSAKYQIRRLLLLHSASALRKREPTRRQFECPVCGYCGVFLDVSPETGLRRHATCPQCTAGERHRLQWLVFQHLARYYPFESMMMLHFAPESFFKSRFAKLVGRYETADLTGKAVDHQEDLTHLSMADGTIDLIFASHVLEHIRDDEAAIREIRRVLKPGGLAILPVPIVAEKTVEYPAPGESGHFRAPGPDYFDRYRRHFARVELHSSSDFDAKYQTWVYEDRSHRPASMLYRPTMAGTKHLDIVPVCF